METVFYVKIKNMFLVNFLLDIFSLSNSKNYYVSLIIYTMNNTVNFQLKYLPVLGNKIKLHINIIRLNLIYAFRELISLQLTFCIKVLFTNLK